jgi:hypothetical protein
LLGLTPILLLNNIAQTHPRLRFFPPQSFRVDEIGVDAHGRFGKFGLEPKSSRQGRPRHKAASSRSRWVKAHWLSG